MRRLVAIVVTLGVLSGFPVARSQEPAVPCLPRLLVLSAFPGEIDRLLTEASLDGSVVAGGRTFYTGSLLGNDVALALTGIGLVNAERTMQAAIGALGCGISGAVLSGVSGGRTFIGDVAIPSEWTIDGGQTWIAADAGMLATASRVAGTVALGRAVPAGDPACAGVDPRAVPTVAVAHQPGIVFGGRGSSADPFGGRRLPCFPGGGDVFGCRPCRAPGLEIPDIEGTATGIVPFLDPAFFFGYFQSPPGLHGYDAEDMETAAVARVAADNAIPFIAFRALSDGKGDPLMLPGFPFQFFVYRQLAADNAAAVALAFLQAWADRA
ncbi:MAG: hypothetical protein ACRDJM_02470 [Actinomycetota bacterium]